MSTDDTPPPMWWSPKRGVMSAARNGSLWAVAGNWKTIPEIPADAVELRLAAPAPDPSARIDVYVKARNVMDVGLVTEEIADGVNVDWWTDHKGDQYVAGVEVLAARSVTIDGQRVSPAPAVPDTGQAPAIRVIQPAERAAVADELHAAQCDCGDRAGCERETYTDYGKMASIVFQHELSDAVMRPGDTGQAPNPLDGADDLPSAVRIQLRDRRDVVAVLREYGHTADEQHVAASVRAALREQSAEVVQLQAEVARLDKDRAILAERCYRKDLELDELRAPLSAPVETPEQQP